MLMTLKSLTIGVLVVLAELTGAYWANSRLTQGQDGKPAQATSSQAETRIVEQAKALRSDNKIEEALALLHDGMDRFPASAQILNEALELYLAENRNDEALQILDERATHFPEETQKRIRSAQRAILQPLIDTLLAEGDVEKAFEYLGQMADAGYRGFHQLRHKALYEPLRRHPGFEEVMKRISENTGLGRPARDFTVTMMNGGTYTLSEQKGKVVLVDFWSTDCGPCREELPNLRALYQANRVRGFELISISLDDKREKLDAFLAAHPMPWNSVFSGKGWKDDTAGLYEVSSIPSAWLVDKQGILRYFDVRGEDLKAAVAKLLAE
jgi:peroxiredoxin